MVNYEEKTEKSVCFMEFLALILLVMAYQWLIIPLTKKKVGYLRDDTKAIFYDYKTKWQMRFEIITVIVVILLIVLLTPVIGIVSVFFVPIGLITVLIVRGVLEKKYMADYRHHIISFLHAFAIFIAFGALIIFAIVSKS